MPLPIISSPCESMFPLFVASFATTTSLSVSAETIRYSDSFLLPSMISASLWFGDPSNILVLLSAPVSSGAGGSKSTSVASLLSHLD